MTFKERLKGFLDTLGIIYGLMLLVIPPAVSYDQHVPYATAFAAAALTFVFPAFISMILFGLSELFLAHSDSKKPQEEV